MASRSDAQGTVKKGKVKVKGTKKAKKTKVETEKPKKTTVSRKLPFLRAGEQHNISPSKFERVLEYISDEERDCLDEFVLSDDDDVSAYEPSSDSSVHSDTEEEDFDDEGNVITGTGESSDKRQGKGKRKRVIGARSRKSIVKARGGKKGQTVGRGRGRLLRDPDRPTVHGVRVVAVEGQEGGEEGGVEDEWVDDEEAPQEMEFTGIPGISVGVPTTPLGFVQLFITRELLNFVSEETNVYALYCRDHLHRAAARNWMGCNVTDIANFIGLSMLMGIDRLPLLRLYWSTERIFGHPIFPQIMNSRKFLQISRYIHTFNKHAVPPNNTDKLILVRPVMEYVQDLCKRLYVPEQNLSLDEGIMPYKGRLSIKTYNPMKPDKYGVKFYFLCEAVSGYVYSFSVYRGVSQSLHDTVFSLLGGLMGQGYHVYMDNFYNSVKLARELYAERVHCTGTLRLQRGAPPQLKALQGKRQPRNFYQHLRNENTLVMCWYDTRLVSLITTFHGTDTAPYEHKKRTRKDGTTTVETVVLDRPIAIREYTKYMQGVDRLDQFMKYYSFLRKSRRWTRKIFFYFMQIGLQNAYALYKKYSTDNPKLTHLQFHGEAIKALIFFDDEAWPVTGPFIQHAPNLDVRQQEDVSDPDDPEAPGTQETPDTGTPQGTRATRQRTPGTPGTPRRSPAVTPRPRIIDPAGRLSRFRKHKPIKIGDGSKRLLKRCRVCYLGGKRKETSFHCCLCLVPLCVRGDCFKQYHSRVKFWESPPAEARRRAPRTPQ